MAAGPAWTWRHRCRIWCRGGCEDGKPLRQLRGMTLRTIGNRIRTDERFELAAALAAGVFIDRHCETPFQSGAIFAAFLRNTTLKLLAGISTSSTCSKCDLAATSTTLSRSRTPQSRFLARRFA